jgi:transcription termination factor Rho
MHMPVLDRSELEASPLADLHAIADQIGLEGFRRLRKADLIDAILGERSPADASGAEESGDGAEDDEPRNRTRRRRSSRLRRGRPAADSEDDEHEAGSDEAERGAGLEEDEEELPARRSERSRSTAPRRSRSARGGDGGTRRGAGEGGEEDRSAEGVVEVLGNGSAFLRVDPPEPSDDDVYISAAQVRRCELVSGDRVSGPVRTPRRSERYPSLVRIDTINGAAADAVADGARYEDLPVAWAQERIALGSEDPTLEAIEWLTPIGKGSRATIVGKHGSGKSDTLRRVYDALSGREGLELSVVLVGVRPEEIADWQERLPSLPAAQSFAASGDSQAQLLERALDAAKRVAARGGDAVVLVDTLDGLPPHAARRALAAARNLREGGSLTILACASVSLGGETTVVALDPSLASTEHQPILDLANSATLHAELLVGEDGAQAIKRARAAAIESTPS